MISHNFSSFHLTVALLTLLFLWNIFYTGGLYRHFRTFNLKWIHHTETDNSGVFPSVKMEVTLNQLRPHSHSGHFSEESVIWRACVKLKFQVSILHDLHGKGDRKLLHIAWKMMLFLELLLVSEIAIFFLMKIHHMLFDYFLFPVLNALHPSYSITLPFECNLRMLEQLAFSFKVTDNWNYAVLVHY